MRRALVFLLPVLALSGGSATAQAGACAPMGWSIALAPTPAAPMPPDGGFLLTLRRSMGGGIGNTAQATTPGSDPFAGARGSLQCGGQRIALSAEAIAPGLARLHASRPLPAGRCTLSALGETREVTVGPAQPPAPRPRLRNLVYSRREMRGRMGGTRTVESVTAGLATPAPANSHGVVLVRDGRTLLGAPLAGLAPGLTFFNTPGRCGARVPGAEIVRSGTRVRARFVDAWGRLSDASDPVAVGAS